MKIIVALDSFKDCLTSEQACAAVAEEIEAHYPGARVLQRPMADGGEGTARTMIRVLDGEWIPKTVTGPLPAIPAEAGFAWFAKTRTALVEMAAASGLELLKPDQRNPLLTTTFGTGELIAAALEFQPETILLAVGGSATVDGGVGAASALGWTFLDTEGCPLPPGGGNLHRLNHIRRPDSLALPPVQVLCDVTNPLCGTNGAARIFAPQKGASPEMVEHLEAGLGHLGKLISRQIGIEVLNLPGAGAAGGLAAGAVAFMDASLVSGIDAVLQLYHLEQELQDADWIITGEGCFDSQSLQGKVVSGILRSVAGSGCQVAVLAGQVKLTPETYQEAGVRTALAIKPEEMPLAEALIQGGPLLRQSTRKLIDSYFSSR